VADLIFVAVIVAFFAVAALFVVACDHIIGADDKQAQGRGAVSPTPDDGPTASSAGARSRMGTAA
jgi:hypothetical protein